MRRVECHAMIFFIQISTLMTHREKLSSYDVEEIIDKQRKIVRMIQRDKVDALVRATADVLNSSYRHTGHNGSVR